MLIVAKVNLGVKKFVSPNAKIFVLCIFFSKHEQVAKKMHSKSEKIDFLQVFLIFTIGIKAKLIELESESDNFP